MEIDESDILGNGEADHYYDENKALACLLADDIVFLNNLKVPFDDSYTTCVYVMANDVFAWGCADAESIRTADGDADSEIIALYKEWKKDSRWGAIRWLCLKRNEQPQRPIRERMIESGAWDDTLAALPENFYDKRCKELHEARLKKTS